MINNSLQLLVNTNLTILTSKSLFYKTEQFFNKTRHISNIDILISKLCETLIANVENIVANEKDKTTTFSCTTIDKFYTFYFKFGYQISETLNKYDIVLFDYSSVFERSSKRADEYVKDNNTIKILIEKNSKASLNKDFNKLYLISNVSGVNLPKLDTEQKVIVETIDKNVLVQGVAGSGKTNICIDKIIFTACKNYTGKVLYTTFSRGLLIDTKLKVENYKQDLIKILNDYKSNQIKFLDNNHKKALENKLGIYFFSDDDNEIFKKIEKIVDYLNNKVDYLLIEDIYNNKFHENCEFVGEQYFIKEYCNNIANHQLEKSFAKLSCYSKEIIYKEIYGMIFGVYDLASNNSNLTKDEYIEKRKGSFNSLECEAIYQIALDYKKHCERFNLLDNNLASKQLIEVVDDFEYSLSIIDEVQDYTQINLFLFKKLSLKMFCVGDALQMINPSYFNFGYLKNLLYEKDLVDIRELKSNYRNTKKITEIIDNLSEINRQEFGTHNFIVKGQSVDSGVNTTALFVRDNSLAKLIADGRYEDVTFVVGSDKDKKELLKVVKSQEVLTVSEIKGLERNNVVVYNILSGNVDKWNHLLKTKVNRKEADENSVYRYYYNLFYVGISRAKQNLIVVENQNIYQFEYFFNKNFDNRSLKDAIVIMDKIISKAEFTQDELVRRVSEFVKLSQFDNARFTASKIRDDATRLKALRDIEIYERFIIHGKYRDAGIKYWEYGMLTEAKQQFTLSNDLMLIELIDMCSKNINKDLNIDIVDYYCDVKDNDIAKEFIVETVRKDVNQLKSRFGKIKENFKKGRK